MQTSDVARLTTLIACSALASACVARTSPQTSDPTEAPPLFAERDSHEESECPSLVGSSQSLFTGRLELQLPVGVGVLVEQGPGQLVVREQIATCVGGRTIARVLVLEQPDDDPNLPITFVRDQLLDHLGLPSGLKISTREADDATRRLTSVIAIPAQPELGHERPTLIFLALRGGAGRIYVVMFETSVEHFAALLPSLTASLDSLQILE